MPEGEHAEDRKISRCPSRAAEPWMLTTMATWGAAKSAGLPPVSDIETADPRLLRGCQILDVEAGLIRLKDSEDANRRATLGKGGARG